MLHGEVDDGGGAAERGRPSAGLEVIGAGGAAKGHVHVGVGIHAAGDDQLALGIDDAVSLDFEAAANQGDGFILDEEIGLIVVHRRDDAAVTNQQRHRPSLAGFRMLRVQ